jgi:hypothetical protein
VIVSPRRCEYPGCTRRGDHRHHIVYYPEEVVKLLCREHHAEITMLNGIQSRRVRHQLSNKHRWWLWYQWTSGKLKPRRTRKALDYIGEWGDSPTSTPPVAEPLQPDPVEKIPEKRQRVASKKRKKKSTRASRTRHQVSAKKKHLSGR